ncbi:MAG: hypothetical protein ACFFCI_09315 [Promethearchaeota archaeon]
MEHKDQIAFSPAKLQKQGRYYKIAVPPEYIEKKLVSSEDLYEVKLRDLKNNKIIPFSPIKLQKQGDYYKIPVPPDLIQQGFISPKSIYEAQLILLKKEET